MAAIIHLPHTPHVAPAPSPRPHLVVIDGGFEAALRRRQPAAVYRRRRAAVAAAALVLVVSALVATGAVGQRGSSAAASTPVVEAVPAAVVVGPGDTLWSIARSIQPSGDVRPLVDALADANGGAAVRVGQRLVVPAA